MAAPQNARAQITAWLAPLSQGEAVTQVARLVRQAPMSDRCAALDQLMGMKDWNQAARTQLRQFRQRECMAQLSSVVTQLALPSASTMPSTMMPSSSYSSSASSSTSSSGLPCGCKPPTPKKPSEKPPMYDDPTGSYSACGQYRGPSDLQTYIDLDNLTSCEAAACAVGTSHGLKRVPFSLPVAPGATANVSVGFGRSAHLVAVTFQRAPLDYDHRNWRISNFETSDLTQAWELYRNGTTFGRDATPPYDPNNDSFPLLWWLEDGDDNISALLHRVNLLPDIIPPTDIGNGTTVANYSLNLDAGAAATETVKGLHWVYFPKK